jgi:hypothetical protein
MKKLVWGVAVGMGLVVSSVQGGAIRYVDDDAPAGGNGLSWETAYTFLQDALFEAANNTSINEIRVAQGAYRPDADEAGNVTPGDREASFSLINGVALMGGYAGPGSADPNDRNIDAYETILSGDLLGDDAPGFVNTDENSWHVLTADSVADAALSGFTVTSGNAQVSDSLTDGGGGLLAQFSSLVVSQCTFRENSADRSGGAIMFSNYPDPSQMRTLTVIDCTLEHNRSLAGFLEGAGGALLALDADVLLTNCQIRDNSTSNGAGGVGSVAFSGTRNIVLVNCSITNNSAGVAGGGIANQDVDAYLVNCVVAGNEALDAVHGLGGGIDAASEGDVHMLNTLVHGNFAQRRGAGVHASDIVSFINCTISRNEAGEVGGGLDLRYGSIGPVRNCVLWGNTAAGTSDEPAQLLLYPNAEVLISFSCVQGLTGNLGGSGNIGADPLFVDANNSDLHLQSGSPCIDAGHNWAIAGFADTDLDGNPRFADGPADDTGCGLPVVVDMGAYEYQGDPFPVKLGDINGDGSVGFTDFLLLLAGWGACTEDCCLPDLDLDGDVGVADFLILLANWG